MKNICLIMVRLLHIASGIYNIAYVYTPLRRWEYGFPVVQYITIPVLVITGFLLVQHRKRAARLAG